MEEKVAQKKGVQSRIYDESPDYTTQTKASRVRYPKSN